MPESNSDEITKVAKKRAATKKTAKKAVAKKKVVRKSAAGKTAVNREPTLFSQRDRYEMIAKMAYFRAEKRGFESGREQEDWLESEKLVDGMLRKA